VNDVSTTHFKKKKKKGQLQKADLFLNEQGAMTHLHPNTSINLITIH
jgi:hypothetical protein